MSLGDYLPSPSSGWQALTAPFKKREGQPWLQGTARNLGHAAFGDKIGNSVDQSMLGDPAQGQLGPVTGSAASLQPNVQPQATLNDGQLATLRQMVAAHMNTQGGFSQ